MQELGETLLVNDTKTQIWMPWLVCFSASLFFFYEFIQGNMFASIADDIMRDFHIQADSMAYMSSVYYLSNVLFLFVAGHILDRFSAKKTIIIAMLICVVSTYWLAHAQSFAVAMICRFLTGIGSAFCFLGPVRIASRWFPAKRMALVTGLIVTMAMTGGMVSQYPLTSLVSTLGWREALIQVSGLGVLMIGFMLFFIREKQTVSSISQVNESHTSFLNAAKQAYFNGQNMRAALYTSLMNMAVAVWGAMMGSLYLMQRLDITKPEAAKINTMLFLGAIVGGPLIGYCSDKLGMRVKPMKVGVLLSLAILLIIIYLPVSPFFMGVLFFLLGLFTGAQVISYALVAERAPAHLTATALSLISIMTQGGYILYQNLYSYLLMGHGEVRMVNEMPVYSLGDYQFANLILPIGLILAYSILKGLKETFCHATRLEDA